MAGEGYKMGFTLKPMTEEMFAAENAPKVPHDVKDDTLYNLCVENKEGANKLVQQGQYDQAIARYSELIMQSRALEQEDDVIWTEEGRDLVRKLRAAAYLNLSLCFIKQKQWTHASNTATRAMIGDKDPPDAKEAVLEPKQKAKALFRRAEAQMEGFGNFDKAKEDLQAALKITPEDKTVVQTLKKVEIAIKKVDKAADKKMTGFLSSNKKVKDGEGIFDEKDRQRDTSAPKLEQPVKLSDGLFLVPKDDNSQETAVAVPEVEPSEANPLGLNYEELSREILEMREQNPNGYNAMRDKAKELVEEMVQQREAEGEEGTGAVLPSTAAVDTMARDMAQGVIESKPAAPSSC